MADFRPPRDNIVRAMLPGPELRETETGLGTMTGHFAVFNQWARIESSVEGRFMERIAPGAFARTIKNNGDRIKVLFQHGKDPQIGDKPLGPVSVLEEDATGARYEVPLLDTSYNRDLLPGLKAGLYGASFRFSVMKDDWNQSPPRSADNPDGLPERTIREAAVPEFGPVTFGAYSGATSGMRSMTDEYLRAALTPDALPASDPSSLTPAGTRETVTNAPTVTVTVTAPSEPIPEPRSDMTTEYITREEKVSRVTELQHDLESIAAEHDGVLPDEAQSRWDTATKEQDDLKRAIAASDTRLARLRATDLNGPGVEFGSFQPLAVNQINRKNDSDIYDLRAIDRLPLEERGPKLRDNAMRVAEQLRVPSPRYDQDKSRERVAWLIDFIDSPDKEIARRVVITNSPQYREAFNRYIASGGQERAAALAVGVDTTGGFSVPVAFDPTMINIGVWTSINPFRDACRIVNISGTDTWQALTATAITAVYATEALAATEGGPTFARPEFIVKRAQAFVTASYEMAQDRPNLPSELGTLFGEAKDNLEATQFAIGVGTTVFPQGMGLKDAYTRVDSVTNDTVAVADIRALEAALPIRHRQGACWFLSRAAIRAIQAFETVNGQLFNSTLGYPAVGNPVSRPSGNTGLYLLGYPVYETPAMPWTPTTDDTTWGVLANPQTFVIVDRVGMSVRVIPDMLDGATPSFPTGEIGIFAFWRNTARVLNVDGGRQGAVQ